MPERLSLPLFLILALFHYPEWDMASFGVGHRELGRQLTLPRGASRHSPRMVRGGPKWEDGGSLPAPSPPYLDQAMVLHLQRQAGNAAVSSVIGSLRRPPNCYLEQPDQERERGAGDYVVARQPQEKSTLGKLLDRVSRQAKEQKKKFAYHYWELAEGKSASSQPDGSVTFDVKGAVIQTTIHLLPDRLATEEEFGNEGDTFKLDGVLYAAKTRTRLLATRFDPKSVHQEISGGLCTIADYQEPTVEISIQTIFRKKKGVDTLEKARSQTSGYGKGATLGEHEASHVADTVSFVRDWHPHDLALGIPCTDFNDKLRAFYNEASNISGHVATYTQGRTDCPGKRNAVFCKVKGR